MVEVNGELRQMVFLTNNFEWSRAIIAELYCARWTVEVLFKELKQILQLKDFLGGNENAVKWQIWTALLATKTSSQPISCPIRNGSGKISLMNYARCGHLP